MPVTAGDRARRGVVLLVVLFFALLLTSGIATFVRRSVVDSLIARNRDASAEAEALVFGGMQLSLALILEDRLQELAGAVPRTDNALDLWSRASSVPLVTPSGTTLRLQIEDTAARLNLNSLFEVDEEGLWKAREGSVAFLERVLEKVIDDLPVAPSAKNYEPVELAANLIDFMDADDLRENGSAEADVYQRGVQQRQAPPRGPLNRPLLSLEELRLVAGFDAQLVDALGQYLTVYPYVPLQCGEASIGCGVNLNTAPPHVLALIWYDDGVDPRLADEDIVRQILRVRDEGGQLCGEGASMPGCTPIREIVPNAIFPPPTFASQVFEIRAEATVGDVRRTGVAVVDRSSLAVPVLLSWRVR
jgi:type II secretory pathway component PulK